MFVQLSVAGAIVIVILSGVFIPDEIFQRAAGILNEEFMYDENDKSNNEDSEATANLKKTLGSLNVALAVSAGLGTLLTAILSYRFGSGRLASMGRKFKNWIRKKEKTPVTMIMKPTDSAFQSESKECLTEQFHEAIEYSSMSNNDGYSTTEGLGGSDWFDNASTVSEVKTKEANVDEVDGNVTTEVGFHEILKAAEKKMAGNSIEGEPKYQTLEARLVAVEGNLMRDIDSRMKIFEQQLEEFKSKVKYGTKDSTDDSLSGCDIMNEFKLNFQDGDVAPETKPSKCVLAEVAATFKNAVPSKRLSPSRNASNPFADQIIGDMASDNESRDGSLSGILSRGNSFSARSSDAGSETVSDGDTAKRSSIPTSLRVVRKKGVNQPHKSSTSPEIKSDKTMKRFDLASANQQINYVASNKSADSPSTGILNQTNRRGPRSRQQLQTILQKTTERLSQRTSYKLRQSGKP